MRTFRSSDRLMVAVAGPAALLIAVEIVVLAMASFGQHPRWPVVAVNASEAAAIRDFAEVARLIERGEDPNRAQAVRSGIIDANEHRLTPLEAATVAERDEIVSYLLMHGAEPAADQWIRLRCYAQREELDDVAAAFDAVRPLSSSMNCDDAAPLLPG
jgi:hypothetical protein